MSLGEVKFEVKGQSTLPIRPSSTSGGSVPVWVFTNPPSSPCLILPLDLSPPLYGLSSVNLQHLDPDLLSLFTPSTLVLFSQRISPLALIVGTSARPSSWLVQVQIRSQRVLLSLYHPSSWVPTFTKPHLVSSSLISSTLLFHILLASGKLLASGWSLSDAASNTPIPPNITRLLPTHICLIDVGVSLHVLHV